MMNYKRKVPVSCLRDRAGGRHGREGRGAEGGARRRRDETHQGARLLALARGLRRRRLRFRHFDDVRRLARS